jgi:hypothetical protein
MLTHFQDGFPDGLPHEERFSFTALSEAYDWVRGFLEVWDGEFHYLFRGGFEGEAVLCRGDGFLLWLEGDTADAIGVTGGRAGDRAFPASHKIVTCCRTMIGQAAIFGQVAYEPVVGISFYDPVDPVVDDVPVISCAILADVLFDADGGDIKFGVMPAGGGVAEEGECRCVLVRLVGSQVKTGMCRGYKGGYGPAFFTETHLAREDIDADASSARQLIERPAIGQLYPIFFRDGQSIPSTAACGI